MTNYERIKKADKTELARILMLYAIEEYLKVGNLDVEKWLDEECSNKKDKKTLTAGRRLCARFLRGVDDE